MKKILVIDDEAWLREMVQMALRQRGYDVVEAENGEVGIEKARSELPDLVLCDVNMEKVDPVLRARAVRRDGRGAEKFLAERSWPAPVARSCPAAHVQCASVPFPSASSA